MKKPLGRWVRAVCAVSTLTLAWCIAPTCLSEGNQLQRAARWVDAHRQTLPATWAEIHMYPLAYQARIMAGQSAEVKVRIWREYLQSVADTDKDLTAPQRAFLKSFAATIAPSDTEWMSLGTAALNKLKKEIPSVLGRRSDLIRSGAFAQGGTPWTKAVLSWQGLQALRVRMSERIVSMGSVSARRVADCNCYQANPIWDGCKKWCEEGECLIICLPSNPQINICNWQGLGCDLFDNRPCDGICEKNPEPE